MADHRLRCLHVRALLRSRDRHPRLNEEPRAWLTAIAYGPGSNPMAWQPGRRQDHRMDLFRYPAFGALDRYLREMLHQLPPRQGIVLYTDVTHWVYSEYGLVNYEPTPDYLKLGL